MKKESKRSYLPNRRRETFDSPLRLCHCSTIDVQYLACDISRIIRGQVDIGRSQLKRLPCSTHRCVDTQSRDVLSGIAGCLQRCPDWSKGIATAAPSFAKATATARPIPLSPQLSSLSFPEAFRSRYSQDYRKLVAGPSSIPSPVVDPDAAAETRGESLRK